MHSKLRTFLPTFALLTVGGLLVAGHAGAQAPQSYAFTDLVGLTGRNSMASAVNNAGDVVGKSNFTDTGRGYRATVWHGTTPTELPYAVSGRSGASDINNQGEIVGTELYGFPTEWKGTGVTTLPTLGSRASGGLGYANAINDRGQVAGEAYLPYPSEGTHTVAVVWNGTKITQLDALGTFNSANAINNRGQAAGSFDFPSSSSYYHAAFWDGKAGTDLGTLGGHSSFAYGINDRGQVVGESNVNPGNDSLHHATIWNGAHATDLGTLGGDSSAAYSINNAGLVVGTSDIASNTYTEGHATLWDHGTAIDLNNFLDPKTVSEGWVLTTANDINDKGWIVGDASNDVTGLTHGFLLTPLHQGSTPMAIPMMLTSVPEPETYAMFLAGLGLLGGMILGRRKVA